MAENRPPANAPSRRTTCPTIDREQRRQLWFSVALILFAAFVLSACVQSETPLLAGSKPLFGMQFQLNLYQDFTEGKALSVKTSVFRWNGHHYSLVSGDSSGVQYFVVQRLDGGNLLIEANENDHVYLLGRKLRKGTYGIVPVDQNDVNEATRNRTCVTRNPVICKIRHAGSSTFLSVRRPPKRAATQWWG